MIRLAPVLLTTQTKSIALAAAVPTVVGAAITIGAARCLVAATRHTIVIVRGSASGRTASVAVLTCRGGTILARATRANFGAVAGITIIAVGVDRASAATRTANPTTLIATGVAAIGQVAVTAEAAVGVAVDLGAAIVGTVITVLTGSTGAVVVARRRIARVGGLVACAAAGAWIATGLTRSAGTSFGTCAEQAVVTLCIAGATRRWVEELGYVWPIERQRAVNGGVAGCIAHIAAIKTAATEELADDRAGAVHDGRSTASAHGGTDDVCAVNEVATRQTGACPSSRVHVMLRINLWPEIGIANPV